jgi:hypothetical protein
MVARENPITIDLCRRVLCSASLHSDAGPGSGLDPVSDWSDFLRRFRTFTAAAATESV